MKRLSSARIRALVCDFDGTLCRTEDRFDPISDTLASLLSNLVRSGMKVAIATGRGDSLRDSIAPSFPPELLREITVGYYSGALISTLENAIESPEGAPEFADLIHWLENTVYARSDNSPRVSARLGQLTMHVADQRQAAKLLAAVRAWLQSTGRTQWRAYCSGHSVDVLDARTSKLRVVEHITRKFGLDPLNDVLKVGDSGHEDGNDFELLNTGLSLSCDNVSANLDACWNFGPKGNNQVDSTIAYLRSLIPTGDGTFRFTEAALVSLNVGSAP